MAGVCAASAAARWAAERGPQQGRAALRCALRASAQAIPSPPLPGCPPVPAAGRHQFMELLELRRSDRSYLRGDRLLLRLDVRVHATDPA